MIKIKIKIMKTFSKYIIFYQLIVFSPNSETYAGHSGKLYLNNSKCNLFREGSMSAVDFDL